MKKVLLTYLLVFLALTVTGQKEKVKNNPSYDYKRLHFGFTVGLNTMDYGIKRATGSDALYYPDVTQIKPGFQVTIVSDLRLAEYWSLRFLPGISFGQRNINYFQRSDTTVVFETRIESSYLDFPLLLKYKSKRINNYRPYLIGGINTRYDMASRKEYDEDTNIRIRTKPLDMYLEIGAGVDFYLKYFKFSTELKVGMGMRNILVDDPARDYPGQVNSIDRLRGYVVMLNFHFE